MASILNKYTLAISLGVLICCYFEGKSYPVLNHEIDVPFEKATFGLGCFWGSDALYGIQKGVLRTRVGYTGGELIKNPTYQSLGDHTEAIEIDFDPNEISYKKLLELFWNHHDPTKSSTRQYASMIFYHDENQKRMAQESLNEHQKKIKDKILTEIAPANIFYPAEDYHQKYRLQAHKRLAKELGLGPYQSDLLQTSYIAAKLNGYLGGEGDPKKFENEALEWGLTQNQINYVKKIITVKGDDLTCG